MVVGLVGVYGYRHFDAGFGFRKLFLFIKCDSKKIINVGIIWLDNDGLLKIFYSVIDVALLVQKDS